MEIILSQKTEELQKQDKARISNGDQNVTVISKSKSRDFCEWFYEKPKLRLLKFCPPETGPMNPNQIHL